MEKLNIAEILKDCPSGMELDCAMYEDVRFLDIDIKSNSYLIRITTPCGIKYLDKYGCYTTSNKAKCVIFPKGKTTWKGFHRPFKDGDIVKYLDSISIFNEWGDETLFRTYVTAYLHGDSTIDIAIPLFGKSIRRETRFATEEERQKLFDTIKTNGYKWNTKTKTLEKLISNKFDITTLKPFDKVLVRTDKYTPVWTIDFYDGHQPNIGGGFTSFGVTSGRYFQQCIPYEGNEHLRGTTNDCDDYYKTWQ